MSPLKAKVWLAAAKAQGHTLCYPDESDESVCPSEAPPKRPRALRSPRLCENL